MTAITDARRLGGRALFVAHTRELVMQARAQFLQTLARRYARAFSLMRSARPRSIISSEQCKASLGT